MGSNGGKNFRLKNRTAIHIAHAARNVQTAGFAFIAVFTVAMAVAAVLLGIRSLWAVPVVVLSAVLVDALMVVRVRADYFRLMGTALCTEAAAQNMAAELRERRRQREAAEQLMRVKQDAEEAVRQAQQRRRPPSSGPSVISLEERRRAEPPQTPAPQTPASQTNAPGELPRAQAGAQADGAPMQTRVMPPVREDAPPTQAPLEQTPRRRRRTANTK